MSTYKLKIVLTALLCAPIQVIASPLFENSAVFDVALSGSIEKVIRDKNNKVEYPFVLEANGVEHRIRVRVRGNSRLRVCDFPPLRLNFSEEDTQGTVFEGQDKLKLVTHCRSRTKTQSDAIQEFVAYRIFNLLSEVSYKVRLLRFSYKDTDKPEKRIERYGFLIESQKELADRTNGKIVKVSGVSLRSIDENHAPLVYIFQYLIGNTDWSFAKSEDDEFCCHNGDLIEIDSKRYYIPYDFDLAGLVDAAYAYPDPALPIRKVTQRMYRGYCASRDELQTALAVIRAKKDEILGVIVSVPGLAETDRADSINFLGRFFARAENEEGLLRSFERQCL